MLNTSWDSDFEPSLAFEYMVCEKLAYTMLFPLAVGSLLPGNRGFFSLLEQKF